MARNARRGLAGHPSWPPSYSQKPPRRGLAQNGLASRRPPVAELLASSAFSKERAAISLIHALTSLLSAAFLCCRGPCVTANFWSLALVRTVGPLNIAASGGERRGPRAWPRESHSLRMSCASSGTREGLRDFRKSRRRRLETTAARVTFYQAHDSPVHWIARSGETPWGGLMLISWTSRVGASFRLGTSTGGSWPQKRTAADRSIQSCVMISHIERR